MKLKSPITIFLTITVILSLTLPAFAAGPVPDIVLKAQNSVVRVVAEYKDGYSAGSGFVVGKNSTITLVATNYHVVSDYPDRIAVLTEDGDEYPVQIVAYTEERDLCVLSIVGSTKLSALKFDDNPKQGELVYTIGYPGDAEYLSDELATATITDGIVSALRSVTIIENGRSVQLIQINADINHGNSGGPLLNADGEVIGINTYGTDSSGINGAVAASELISFLKEKGLNDYVQKSSGSAKWLIYVAIAVAAIVLAAVLIVNTAKKRTNTRKHKNLREFIRSEGPVTCSQAVSMLMPVLVQLRDLNTQGRPHLEVSPSTILLKKNQWVLAPSSGKENQRYSDGFAAPEIYHGKNCGIYSDLYSFAAVMFYVLTGKRPKNALDRQNNPVLPLFDPEEIDLDPEVEDMIETCLSLNPKDRTMSFQKLIYILSPYNSEEFSGQEIQHRSVRSENNSIRSDRPHGKRNPVRIGKIIRKTVIVTLLLAIVAYVGMYAGAVIALNNNNVALADQLTPLKAVTKLYDYKLVTYINSCSALKTGLYDNAISGFKELQGYRDSADKYNEARYAKAMNAYENQQYDEAAAILQELGTYSDSSEMINTVKCGKIDYLLKNNDFESAEAIYEDLKDTGYSNIDAVEEKITFAKAVYNIFEGVESDFKISFRRLRALAQEGNTDAQALLPEALEKAYQLGEKYYNEGNFSEASAIFYMLGDYKDSEKYHTAANAHDSLITVGYNELLDIIDFKDVKKILISYTDIAEQFLRGMWRSSKGEYFEMIPKYEGALGTLGVITSYSTSYSLPNIELYNSDFYIENGIYKIYNATETKNVFRITVLNEWQIQVYCYKDGSNYILYRQ